MAELIIVFREVLEASLIIGILYTFLKQTNQEESIVKLWQGVLVALVVSIIGSFVFQQFAGGFQGQAEKLFEGVVMIVAASVLGTVIVWMAKNKNIAEDLKGKAEQALSSNKVGLGIFLLAFISVFREGIETILFLYGVMMKQGGLSISLSLLGAAMGIGVGYLIFVQGKKVPLKTFFNVSSILLIFVAAGMFAYGIHELESAGVIPDYGRIWDINPPKFADGSYPLMHDKGYVGSLLKGLFGYNGDPSLIELLTWLFSLSGLTYLWNKVS
ncbi:MAG: high-affinity iron transporter [Candidatus Marinimicrobia bacterium]|nr:high-affinity iron transporter [Candidatus Neomarinimicrobiota bacterium]|tara:strand:+ start:606 stop:1418 length:813 start_codon:yes stop_codon:yes gene_type:complete